MFNRFSLILAFILLSGDVISQYRNLAFEGAGIRGIAYAGVVEALEKHGILDSIEKVGGTSAGAVIATAVALGYRGDEITRINVEADYTKFNDSRFWIFGSIHRLFKTYGWYRGKAFREWIGEVIEEKTGNPDITFAELKAFGAPELHLTGVSLNNQKLLIFSAENYPDMKVADAVLISISIPFYFQAVAIDQQGKIVKNYKRRKDIDLAVDGGVTANYPIFLFDDIDSSGFRMIRRADTTTLGIRIDTDLQLDYDRNEKGLAPREINNLSDFTGAIFTYMLENLNRNYLTPEDWKRTISVPDSGIGVRIRNLSPEQKETLVTNGYNAVEDFLKRSHYKLAAEE